MAAVLTGYAESGIARPLFLRRRGSDGAFWNTATPGFEAYNAANIANYGIAATETGATGIYTTVDPADDTLGDFLFIAAEGANLTVTDVATNRLWQGDAGPAGLSGNVTVGGYATGQDPATLVLDANASDHTTDGSIGAAIQGDPLATVVPGVYAVNTAGYRIGTYLTSPVVPGPSSGDMATQLTGALQSLITSYCVACVSPKPTYSIDGQSVSWGDYLRMLSDTIKSTTELIAYYDPVEMRTSIL